MLERGPCRKGRRLIFSALLNFFFRACFCFLLLLKTTFERELWRYYRSDVGSQSDVAEPEALEKSRQKLCFSNLSGKLSFFRTETIGNYFILLLDDPLSSSLQARFVSWLVPTVVDAWHVSSRSDYAYFTELVRDLVDGRIICSSVYS